MNESLRKAALKEFREVYGYTPQWPLDKNWTHWLIAIEAGHELATQEQELISDELTKKCGEFERQVSQAYEVGTREAYERAAQTVEQMYSNPEEDRSLLYPTEWAYCERFIRETAAKLRALVNSSTLAASPSYDPLKECWACCRELSSGEYCFCLPCARDKFKE